MSWSGANFKTYIWIFPVGRGSAAFLRSPLNHGFILDMGGGGEYCDPASFIKEHFISKLDAYQEKKIAQAILSHPHYDHIAQCAQLAPGEELDPHLITCPNDKLDAEKLNFERFDQNDALDAYRTNYEPRNAPLQTIQFTLDRTVPNLEYGICYVWPPVCEKLHESADNEYGNATSIVFYYRHGDHTILFPGDITPEAMAWLLEERPGTEKRHTKFDARAAQEHPSWHLKTEDQPSLKSVLQARGLTILVAPHHGLESCYSEQLYGGIKGGKPDLVVLSERRKARDGDGQTDRRYQSEEGASGIRVRGETRRSVSTKDGDHILIVFSGTGSPEVHLDQDAEVLLKIASP